MKMLRNIALTAGIFTLTGCTAFSSFSEVDALNAAQPVGSPFTQALANEYKMFSNTELKDMFDYPDALHFARKGLAAASGDVVLPEPIDDWNLEEKHIQELSAARSQLMRAFLGGARESAPEIAARAQGKFDCWIERQEESYDGTIQCQNQFMEALNQLGSYIQAPPPQAEPPQDTIEWGTAEPQPEALPFEVDASQPMEAQDAMYLVFFNWDSSNLGDGADSVLDAVGTEVANNTPSGIKVVGHTDTSGAQDYNQRLAFKRANTVKDALVKRGVDASLLQVDARGEDELLVPTADDVREPANRRVNISFN